jgi:alkanesulfonate monooxygenase SsuD/methylene tetrahydromethanopterin reductase-like flavin-dependent oxidoreductase (luciferase family)/hemerythrin-like domain-containing protein
MADYRHDLQFGVFITPLAGEPVTVLELARLADAVGLDLVTFQDHPYQPRFLDAWTVLSVVAAETINVRVAPNVANLPLRPPVVLARSVASLDVLSGGRVELGLGAGFFWEAIAANGGAMRTPGQAVDALAEAIDVIRATWATDAGPIHHAGTYYSIDGARPGPAPVHDVEIWLGAYKPRMLALTGAKADGWLPSTGYVELDQLAAGNAAIDDAAAAAGRRPEQIRRLLNISGTFGSGGGFLQGTPSDWAQQLGELTLASGLSTYIMSAASADDIRRFAEEVAPAVRELVANARGAAAGEPWPGPAAPAAVTTAAAPLLPRPTPDDGRRLSDQPAWDESSRPTGAAPDPAREYTPRQQAAGQHLIDVHDYLRAELSQLRELVGQVAAGNTNPAAVRSYLNRMTIRQNNWTLGTFCETYCRTVTSHHMLEDSSIFPHLRVSDEQLAPVIERLEQEHLQIHDFLERVDQALIALVAAQGDGIDRVSDTLDLLTDALLSHFSYEERELVEPLARLGFY